MYTLTDKTYEYLTKAVKMVLDNCIKVETLPPADTNLAVSAFRAIDCIHNPENFYHFQHGQIYISIVRQKQVFCLYCDHWFPKDYECLNPDNYRSGHKFGTFETLAEACEAFNRVCFDVVYYSAKSKNFIPTPSLEVFD